MTTYRAEDQQGHATHFLKRLRRASGEAAELALQLYHDPQLLRESLSGVRIPESFDRVAISLHEADAGPYIVTSRTGKFVTCLGEEMSTKGLHLIPYAQLKAHMNQSEIIRERLALAKDLVGEGGELDRLFERVRQKGDGLSREEMLAISAVQPALQPHLFAWSFKAMVLARDLSRHLHRLKKIGKKEEPTLRQHWCYFWAAGHLLMLSGMNRIKNLESLFKSSPSDFVLSFSTLLRSGRPYMAMRLAWLIGKVGPTFLPECRRLLIAPGVPEAWLLGLLGTIVIGIRHRKTRSQALKAISGSFHAVEKHPMDVRKWILECDEEPTQMLAYTLHALLEPDEMFNSGLGCSKELCVEIARENAFPTPYNWHSIEQVPDDLAFAIAANIAENYRHQPRIILLMLTLTPWLARCEAEDIYLPQAFHNAIYSPWSADAALRLVEDEKERLGKQMPVKADKTPSRNDPCPCGSGKKYKKCCG